MPRKKIELDKETLLESYERLSSISKTAEELHTTPFIVRERLLDASATMNKRGQPNKYHCNDDFFSTDTAESFYWAGFWAADGCVMNSPHGGKRVFLGSADIEHIEKFKKCVCYDGQTKIKYPDPDKKNKDGTKAIICGKKPLASIVISSGKMFDDLARFGVVPKKSLIYTVPEWIKQHPLVSHFVRGCTDGDGCWSMNPPRGTGRTKNTMVYTLCGTKDLIDFVMSLFSEKCGTKATKKPYKQNSIFSLSYSGNIQAKAIRNFLYDGANEEIWLNRKHEIAYNDWIDTQSEYTQVAVIGTNPQTGEIIRFDSMTQAEHHGFNHSGISEACSGKRRLHKGYRWTIETNTQE